MGRASSDDVAPRAVRLSYRPPLQYHCSRSRSRSRSRTEQYGCPAGFAGLAGQEQLVE